MADLLGWLRNKGRVDYQTPQAEPGAHATAHVDREDEIAAIDRQLDEAFHYGEMALVDRLLDMRNAVRPPRPRSVPVIPGRTS